MLSSVGSRVDLLLQSPNTTDSNGGLSRPRWHDVCTKWMGQRDPADGRDSILARSRRHIFK